MGMIEMTNQTIEIADLIKPKFQPGKIVYILRSDTNGIESIRRALIDEIRFTVRFTRDQNSDCQKSTELVYDLLNLGQAREESLFATAEEAARAVK